MSWEVVGLILVGLGVLIILLGRTYRLEALQLQQLEILKKAHRDIHQVAKR